MNKRPHINLDQVVQLWVLRNVKLRTLLGLPFLSFLTTMEDLFGDSLNVVVINDVDLAIYVDNDFDNIVLKNILENLHRAINPKLHDLIFSPRNVRLHSL